MSEENNQPHQVPSQSEAYAQWEAMANAQKEQIESIPNISQLTIQRPE